MRKQVAKENMASIDWFIGLLEEIEASPEKQEWCRAYSVYTSNLGQEELLHDLNVFVKRAYENGLVISNYQEVLRRWQPEERSIANSDPEWLETQPYLCVLACIAWHFRRDHFCEGSLINQSIADGIMLRLFRRLKLVCPTLSPPTTLQSLYCCECENIPEKAGVYWVLRPAGMPIRFTEQIYNRSAPLYSAELLSNKYLHCQNQEVLYIGKADGKKGLRQRLKQYMNYGWNNATNHKGGRAIWQIEDAGLLLLAYEECEDARAREKQLLSDYKAENGCYPLANWRG